VIYALVRKKGEKLGVSVKSASTMWQMKCTRNSNRQAGGVEIWGKGENGFSMAVSVALGGRVSSVFINKHAIVALSISVRYFLEACWILFSK